MIEKKYKLLEFEPMGDENGWLIALEENKNIPFEIKRVYYIYETRKNFIRGKHAHKTLKQVFICIKGECKVSLDDGYNKKEIMLDSPKIGLYIEPILWREIYDFSNDCILLVISDSFYDEYDYIHSYEEFKNLVLKK